MTIYLKVKTSSVRETISIEIQNENPQEIISTIVGKLTKEGYFSVEEKLYFEDNIKVTSKNILNYVKDDILYITYKDIISPYGAKEYHRENGVIFYFNSNEDNHSHTPHVHVNYNEDNIFVFLENLAYKGKLKNKSVLKRALKYIKENKSDLMEKWYIYHPTYK